MIVNWTNHLDEVITNHDSETLEFEQVIIKTLIAGVNYAVDVSGNIVQDIMLSSEAEISNSAEALVSRERSDGSSVLLDVEIDSLINRDRKLQTDLHYSLETNSQQTRDIYSKSAISNEHNITSTQSREMSSSVNNNISIELTASQVRERMLIATNSIQLSLQSTIKKFVGYFQTIMTKIKE